jgi:hypothetical protein
MQQGCRIEAGKGRWVRVDGLDRVAADLTQDRQESRFPKVVASEFTSINGKKVWDWLEGCALCKGGEEFQ